MNRKRTLFVIFCIIVVCSLLAIPLLLRQIYPPHTLQPAISKAIAFFEGAREPYSLLMLDVMHRRFGIAEFADALQRYDEVLAKSLEQAPLLRVFRRIADYDNTLQAGDLAAVWKDYDQVTVPALYCDRFGLPENYPEFLELAVTLGGYWVSHVLLAWIWIQENGCEFPLPEGFIEDLYLANAALIDDDPVVTDLEFEAAAFLYLAGQGTLVDDAFVERVIAVQNDNGGWSYSSDMPGSVPNWHVSILGLMILLHVEYPADSYPPMLAPASR
jgi:hypothetical protein